MKGPRNLRAALLALLLATSALGDIGRTPKRLAERRNWTPQAMLYLKGAQGRRFIWDHSQRKGVSEQPPPEKRSSKPQPLLPETTALLLALLKKLQDATDGEENFNQRRFLEDRLLTW
ncbi:spexin [Perognathus longimembris pacificus]|uniref:spexin n=1 Tax=Perognathus longimembris pacificus TaxID=214514 RepID=UPI0020192710|nr:spexin [Perognathus longimembris pacificus]